MSNTSAFVGHYMWLPPFTLCLPSQEAFPARFKSLHLVHQPWYISIVYRLAKPFIKPKFKDRVSSAVLSWSLPSQWSLLPPDTHEWLRYGSSAGTLPSRDTVSCRLQWPSSSSLLLLTPETSGALCWCLGATVATVCLCVTVSLFTLIIY